MRRNWSWLRRVRSIRASAQSISMIVLLELVRREPRGVEAADDRSHAGAGDVVDRDAQLLEHPEHADVSAPLAPPPERAMPIFGRAAAGPGPDGSDGSDRSGRSDGSDRSATGAARARQQPARRTPARATAGTAQAQRHGGSQPILPFVGRIVARHRCVVLRLRSHIFGGSPNNQSLDCFHRPRRPRAIAGGTHGSGTTGLRIDRERSQGRRDGALRTTCWFAESSR